MASSAQHTVIILGCLTAGKTLLRRQLARSIKLIEAGKSLADSIRPAKAGGDEREELASPETRPTTGLEIDKLTTEKGRFDAITLKEVGGAMAPIWPKYVGDASTLLFVVDLSQPTQLAAAQQELYGLLRSGLPTSSRAGVVFAKTDAPGRMDVQVAVDGMRLRSLAAARQADGGAELKAFACSSLSGKGLAPILSWLTGTVPAPASGDSGAGAGLAKTTPAAAAACGAGAGGS